MNSFVSCLTDERLQQLSENELSPPQLEALEEHVTGCESCRRVLEESDVEPSWWAEVRNALAGEAEGGLGVDGCGREDAAHDAGVSTQQFLKLLGPTDDPRMLGRIGGYEIVGILGCGGMGVVFKGFDAALNRYVAIKMLLPHLASSGASRKRFAREAQAAAAVVDDYVMAIHSVAEWQGVPYLVMPYSRGVSLEKRIEDEGPLEVREILRIGMQTAAGLSAAHAQGLVHRDVKPANILLAEGVERVTLTDFGLARAVDDASLTRVGMLAGTPQYMSPEQAQSKSVDAQSDLFSLGSVLYAMCTGRPPFRAESSYAVLRQITDAEPRPIRELNPEIPDWLCAIVSRLMSKRPEDRYASAREVSELLERCLAHVQQPLALSLPTSQLPRPTASRFTLRSKGVSLMVAALALGLIAILGWQASDLNGPQTTGANQSKDSSGQVNGASQVPHSQVSTALQTAIANLAWDRRFSIRTTLKSQLENGRTVEEDYLIRRLHSKWDFQSTVTTVGQPRDYPGNTTNRFLSDGEAWWGRTTSPGRKRLGGSRTVVKREQYVIRAWEGGSSGFALDGHFPGNEGKTLMEVLADSPKLDAVEEDVDGRRCLRVSARGDFGTISVWLDPMNKYCLRKATVLKERGNLYSGSRVGEHRDTVDTESYLATLTDVEYKTVGEHQIAASGKLQLTLTRNGKSPEKWVTTYRRTEIDLNPDFQGTDAFKPDFEDGARISDWDSTDRTAAYTWQGGRLIPLVD